MTHVVTITHNYISESVEVTLNDLTVTRANHDEHGWAGIEEACKMARRLADVLDAKLVEVDQDGDEVDD